MFREMSVQKEETFFKQSQWSDSDSVASLNQVFLLLLLTPLGFCTSTFAWKWP